MKNVLELLKSLHKRSARDLPIKSLSELEQAIHLIERSKGKREFWVVESNGVPVCAAIRGPNTGDNYSLEPGDEVVCYVPKEP